MRCPYCGTTNPDQAAYCIHCLRDLKQPQPNQNPPNQRRQGAAPPVQGRPVNMPRIPQQQPTMQRRHAPIMPQSTQASLQPETPVVLPEPAPPEPLAPFPPRTIEQLHALEPGALAYIVVNSATGDGRKKIVRIVYPRCIAWQQVATLLKALKEQQEDRFDTVIIQGVLDQDTQVYSFTNGQLVFDRNVRLGSLITNRYQIETGNGFENDSMRIVLTE